MNESESKYEEIKEKILEISNMENIESIIIPNWNPVSIEEGIKWIRSTIFEGYYVKYRIKKIEDKKYIEVINWEYGEEEPNFA
jgi:hypothetical protein